MIHFLTSMWHANRGHHRDVMVIARSVWQHMTTRPPGGVIGTLGNANYVEFHMCQALFLVGGVNNYHIVNLVKTRYLDIILHNTMSGDTPGTVLGTSRPLITNSVKWSQWVLFLFSKSVKSEAWPCGCQRHNAAHLWKKTLGICTSLICFDERATWDVSIVTNCIGVGFARARFYFQLWDLGTISKSMMFENYYVQCATSYTSAR